MSDPLDFARLAEERRWMLLELYGLSETEDGKRPMGERWQHNGKLAAVGRVTTWRERGSNAGLLPGLSRLAVLDVEPLGLATWPRECFPAGVLLVRTPSLGLHAYCDLAAVERVLGREVGHLAVAGAELIGRTGQVVVPPSVARSRKADPPRVGEYTLEQAGEPIADEALLAELLAPFRAAVEDRAARNGQHEPATIAPGVFTTTYGRKVLGGARKAILGATRGDPENGGHKVFLARASRVFAYVAGGDVEEHEAEAVLRDAYASVLPDEMHELERLLADARGYGFAEPRSSRQRAALLVAAQREPLVPAARVPESQAAPTSRDEIAPREASATRIGAAPAAKTQAEDPFRWYARHELPECNPDEDIVRDFIGPREAACLAGASGSGKSFVALDLAVAVAGERAEFLGMKVQRHGPVLYLCAEGFESMRARLIAADPDDKAGARLRFARRVPMLLEGASVSAALDSARKLIAGEMQGREPLLLVLDTFARAVAGADENDNGAMSAAADSAAAFTRELGCTVLLVHHTKKDRKPGESFLRGASSLRGTLDCAWGIELVPGVDFERIVSTEKQKDRPDKAAWRIRLAPVTVGKKETLRVAEARALPFVEYERMAASKQAAARILRRDEILLTLWGEGAGLPPAELRERLILRGFSVPERTLRDALDKLRAAELLDVRGTTKDRRALLTERGKAEADRLLSCPDRGRGLPE